jgi:hypothetical protein
MPEQLFFKGGNMKALLAMTLALGSLSGIAAAGEPVSSKADPACTKTEVLSPEQQVTCVMRAYIEVTDQADGPRARTLFHPNALMSGDLGTNPQTGAPELYVGTPEPFLKGLESAPKRPGEIGYKAHVQSVRVLGKTAIGEVVEENLFGRDFTNSFHLLKTDGRWLIVSKLSYATAADSR